MTSVPGPTISVVVCTRNRSEDMRRCLASLLRMTLPAGSQILVVDQSPGPETAALLASMAAGRPDVEYHHSRRTGLSVARNHGAARARGDVLLFTDDDCEVSVDWVLAWQRMLRDAPDVGVAFGRVTAPPFDPHAGHIPHFDVDVTRTWGQELLWRGASAVGMGANMAVRRESWRAVGGFDEGLGAGARYPAAEEIDLTLRILRAGGRAGHAIAPSVVHHGFRPSADASVLVTGYATATGAMYMKHLRAGDRRAAGVLLSEVGRLGWRVTRGLATNTRPLGVNSLRGLVRGAVGSRKQSIDRARRVYLAFEAGAQDEVRAAGVTVR